MSITLRRLLSPGKKYGTGGGGRTHNLRFRRCVTRIAPHGQRAFFAIGTPNSHNNGNCNTLPFIPASLSLLLSLGGATC